MFTRDRIATRRLPKRVFLYPIGRAAGQINNIERRLPTLLPVLESGRESHHESPDHLDDVAVDAAPRLRCRDDVPVCAAAGGDTA